MEVELRMCRHEQKMRPITEFAKNPGRQSLRLDCNTCRSIIQYQKLLAKRKIQQTYVPKKFQTSEVLKASRAVCNDYKYGQPTGY